MQSRKGTTLIETQRDTPLYEWLVFVRSWEMPGTPKVIRTWYAGDSAVFEVEKIVPFERGSVPPSDLIVPLHMHYSYVAKLGREYPATDSAKALDEFMKYDGRWCPTIGIEAFALNETRRLILWNPVGNQQGSTHAMSIDYDNQRDITAADNTEGSVFASPKKARIKTPFNGTVSGRITNSQPNFQNIPGTLAHELDKLVEAGTPARTIGELLHAKLYGTQALHVQSNDPLYGITYDELSKVIVAEANARGLSAKQYVVNQLTRIYEEENAQKQAAVDKERQRDEVLRELDTVAEKVRTFEAVIRDVDTAMNSLFVLNHIKTASALQVKSRNLQRSLATYKNHAAALRAKLDAFE